MKLREDVFLENNYSKVLYSDNSDLGTEYILKDNGVFTEYFFINGECVSIRNINFNEFFKQHSKGSRALLVICRTVRLEVLSLLMIGLFIKRNLAIEVLSNTSLLKPILIGVISFCLIEILFRGKTPLTEVYKGVLQLYLVINLGKVVIISFGGSVLTTLIVILLVSLYIMAIAFSVTIKVNLNSLYDDLIVKYQG